MVAMHPKGHVSASSHQLNFDLYALLKDLVGELMAELGRQGQKSFRLVSKELMETYFGGFRTVISNLKREKAEFKKEKEKERDDFVKAAKRDARIARNNADPEDREDEYLTVISNRAADFFIKWNVQGKVKGIGYSSVARRFGISKPKLQKSVSLKFEEQLEEDSE